MLIHPFFLLPILLSAAPITFEIIPLPSHPHQERSKTIESLPDLLGPGVCVFDYDNDGLQDIMLVGGKGTTRTHGKKSWWNTEQRHTLLKNLGGETFMVINSFFDVATSSTGMGCSTTDLDNDGLNDIVISGYGHTQIIQNSGNDQFIQKSQAIAPFTQNKWTTGITSADYDNDGDMDLYIGSYVDYKKHQRTLEKNKGFSPTSNPAFLADNFDAQTNLFLKNNGNWQFEDIAKANATDHRDGRTLFVNWQLINDDALLDLIITNDIGSKNVILSQNDDGTFKALNSSNQLHLSSGASSAQIQNLFDLSFYIESRGAGRPHTLSLRDPSNEWSDYGWQTGLNTPENLAFKTWNLIFEDFNGDGSIEVFAINGSLTPQKDYPLTTTPQKDLMFSIRKNPISKIEFTPANLKYLPMTSARGAATLDANNDGKTDVVIASNNGPAYLLINTSAETSNWIGVNFSNSHHIKSLSLSSPTSTQTKSTRNKAHYLSESSNQLIFYTKNDVNYLSYTDWNNTNSEKTLVTKNHYYTLTEFGEILENNSHPRAEGGHLSIHSFNKLLALKQEPNHHSNILLSAFRKLDINDQIETLNIISQSPAPSQEAIFLYSLTSNHTKLQLAAINGLKNLESEPGIHYLLGIDPNNNTDLTCAISNMMHHIFIEEEAIIERKKLMINWLIKASQTASEGESICILNALGESDSRRPLTIMLNSIKSSSEKISAAATAALGNLKRTESIEIILANMRESNSPLVKAESLLALKRLNYCCYNDELKATINTESLEGRMALISHLITSNNRIVIDFKTILNLLDKEIQHYKTHDASGFSDDYKVNLASAILYSNETLANEYFPSILSELSQENLSKLSAMSASLPRFLSNPLLLHKLLEENHVFDDAAKQLSATTHKLPNELIPELLKKYPSYSNITQYISKASSQTVKMWILDSKQQSQSTLNNLCSFHETDNEIFQTLLEQFKNTEKSFPINCIPRNIGSDTLSDLSKQWSEYDWKTYLKHLFSSTNAIHPNQLKLSLEYLSNHTKIANKHCLPESAQCGIAFLASNNQFYKTLSFETLLTLPKETLDFISDDLHHLTNEQKTILDFLSGKSNSKNDLITFTHWINRRAQSHAR